MKKLFISCPMRGRTDEDIKVTREKMHKVAEALFGEELEVIDSHIPPAMNLPADTRKNVWCLGRSIQMMAEADYYIGAYAYGYSGCMVENEVAHNYFDPDKTIMLEQSYLHMVDVQEATRASIKEALSTDHLGN